MSRLWVPGTPILATVSEANVPTVFYWRNKPHYIRTVANYWRVDQGWWNIHISREYFSVTTSTGLYADIFHDLLTDEWYMQRLHD